MRKADIYDRSLRKILKDINLQSLIGTYMAVHPYTSQLAIAKRFGVGQMTISRILSNGHKVKEEWIPVIIEMLHELNDANVSAYAQRVSEVADVCDRLFGLDRSQIACQIVFDEILSNEQNKYEVETIAPRAFQLADHEAKTRWYFHDVFWITQDNPEPYKPSDMMLRVFPTQADRVTLYATNETEFQRAKQWYSFMHNWISGASFKYLNNQSHRLILIDIETRKLLIDYNLKDEPHNLID